MLSFFGFYLLTLLPRVGVGASYDLAAASLSNAALAAVTNPDGAPTEAAAAFLFPLEPGGDVLLIFFVSKLLYSSPLVSDDDGDRLCSPYLVPTRGEVGDNSYSVFRGDFEPLRNTGPIGPGDLVSSQTNSSAIRLSRVCSGVATALLPAPARPPRPCFDSTSGDASEYAPAEWEGLDGKYTVGVAPIAFRLVSAAASSNAPGAGARDVTPKEVTLPGVLNAAPADIHRSDDDDKSFVD